MGGGGERGRSTAQSPIRNRLFANKYVYCADGGGGRRRRRAPENSNSIKKSISDIASTHETNFVCMSHAKTY